jgi:plasmid replication initiation protein
MPRKDPKKYLIRQSNTLSFSRHNLNAVEKRIVYLLVSRLKPDDKAFQEYEFTVQELLKGIDLGHNNHQYLKETTESLIGKVYNLPYEGGLLQISPISSALYNEDNTIVKFSFDPKMKAHYLELKSNYTQFQLEIVLGLKSVYSQKLYEMAKSIANKGDPTVRYSVSEWRYLLYIEDHEYKQYKDMRKNVFEIAQRELDEKTDIHLEYKEEKAGKRINWLWMEVHKIENDEQRQAWIRQTKFNQLPKKVRDKLLAEAGATEGHKINDVAANVTAKQKAIVGAEEKGLFDKKPPTTTDAPQEVREE